MGKIKIETCSIETQSARESDLILRLRNARNNCLVRKDFEGASELYFEEKGIGLDRDFRYR